MYVEYNTVPIPSRGCFCWGQHFEMGWGQGTLGTCRYRRQSGLGLGCALCSLLCSGDTPPHALAPEGLRDRASVHGPVAVAQTLLHRLGWATGRWREREREP